LQKRNGVTRDLVVPRWIHLAADLDVHLVGFNKQTNPILCVNAAGGESTVSASFDDGYEFFECTIRVRDLAARYVVVDGAKNFNPDSPQPADGLAVSFAN
jgi:hypothetical protein